MDDDTAKAFQEWYRTLFAQSSRLVRNELVDAEDHLEAAFTAGWEAGHEDGERVGYEKGFDAGCAEMERSG